MKKKLYLSESNIPALLEAILKPKKDKLKHLIAGILCGLYGDIPLATGLFVGKEIHDCYKKNPTGFSFADLVYDYVGFVIGLLIKMFFIK